MFSRMVRLAVKAPQTDSIITSIRTKCDKVHSITKALCSKNESGQHGIDPIVKENVENNGLNGTELLFGTESEPKDDNQVWKESIATTSEAIVKAERHTNDGDEIEQLQTKTVQHIYKYNDSK